MSLDGEMTWREKARRWVEEARNDEAGGAARPALRRALSAPRTPLSERKRNVNSQRAARFEKYVKMRLAGDTDVIYRAYDILTPDRLSMPLKRYIYAAGLEMPVGGTKEVLSMLQHRYRKWGYGIVSHEKIMELLHEFWVYNRIKHGGKKNWPYREPEVSRALYEEHERREYKKLKDALK